MILIEIHGISGFLCIILSLTGQEIVSIQNKMLKKCAFYTNYYGIFL
jgi:hypothetical protein